MPAVPLMTRAQLLESMHIIRDGWNQEKVRAVIKQEANGLARAMEARVHVRQGDLRNSIRVEEGSSKFASIVFWVKAGGSATTTHGYDYSMATEFGTRKEHARPFFWNTYRAMAPGIRRRIEAAIWEAVEELNQGNVVRQQGETNPAHQTLDQRAGPGRGRKGMGSPYPYDKAALGHELGDF
jgi:HK97 gp10 family phage protein